MRKRIHRAHLHWGLLCGVVSAVLALVLTSVGAFNAAEMILLDWRHRSAQPLPLPSEITIVSLDDKGLRRLIPYPRDVLAKIIRRLKEYGARVIVLDVLLDERRPEEDVHEDTELLDAIMSAGNVVLPAAIEDNRFIEPHPFFRAVAAGVGHSHSEASPSDGVTRWFLPVLLPPDVPRPTPSVALVAMLLSRGRWGKEISSFSSYDDVARTFHLPLDEQGQLRIAYRMSAAIWQDKVPSVTRMIPYHPARTLLEETGLPGEWFRNRIVLVGAISPVFGDRHKDPFTAITESSSGLNEGTPGVMIQAQMLSSLLQTNRLRDIPFAQQEVAVILCSILFGVVLFLFPLAFALPLTFAFAFAVLCIGKWMFIRHGFVIAETPFLSSAFLGAVVSMGTRYFIIDRAARRDRRTFSRYMHPRVVEELLESSAGDSLGNTQRRTVTILFSDIRSYTQATSHMSPESIVALLNEYFTLISREVLEREGWIDKYIGDGMMALFGMFSEADDGALNAVRAAVAMRDALSDQRVAGGSLQLKMGIGIHTGDVVTGDMGSPEHRDHTAIGADVNLASRVEGMTKELKAEILLTESTYRIVAPFVEVTDRGLHPIRGFDEMEFRLFELISVQSDATK